MEKRRSYYVYIMTNQHNTVLYVGVSNSLLRRCYEHKNKSSYNNCFTKKYNINKLVYYEEFSHINDAIDREKQLKGGPRKRKIELIEKNNSAWEDLYGELNPIYG